MQDAQNYPSDLSENQWQIIKRLLPKVARLGRKPIDRRTIMNAIPAPSQNIVHFCVRELGEPLGG